jgi:hypothetical protein
MDLMTVLITMMHYYRPSFSFWSPWILLISEYRMAKQMFYVILYSANQIT